MKTRKPDEPVMCLQCGVPMVMTPNGHWACPTTIEAKRMLELAIASYALTGRDSFMSLDELAGAAVQPSSPADGQPVAEGVARAEVVPYPYGEGRTDQPDAVLRDAERYRYMRNNASFRDRNGPGLYWYLPRFLPGGGAEQLDAAIDAELRRTADPTTEILSTTAKGG